MTTTRVRVGYLQEGDTVRSANVRRTVKAVFVAPPEWQGDKRRRRIIEWTSGPTSTWSAGTEVVVEREA